MYNYKYYRFETVILKNKDNFYFHLNDGRNFKRRREIINDEYYIGEPINRYINNKWVKCKKMKMIYSLKYKYYSLHITMDLFLNVRDNFYFASSDCLPYYHRYVIESQILNFYQLYSN